MQKLVVLLTLMTLLFSCERKYDETAKIQLQLPARTKALSHSDPLAAITNPLYSVTPFTTTANFVETSLNDTKSLFNSLQPSLAANSSLAVNCLLLVVSGPESEPDFSRNFCVKKSDPGSNLAEDASSSRLNFGPYVGLIDAFNYNNTIDLELNVGPDRVFTLLGFYSSGACTDIFSALRDKSKLTKAYFLGRSEPQKLIAGNMTIPLPMLSAIDPAKYYSDCVIPDPQTIFPVFTSARLRKTGFPYDTFRSFSVAPAAGTYKCEAVDFELRATDPVTHLSVPGTVDGDTFFNLKQSNGTIIPTYESEQSCSQDKPASAEFLFLKNQISQKRWFRQERFGTGNVSLVFARSGVGPLVSATFKQSFSPTEVFFDTFLPTVVEPGMCYEVTSVLRDIEGYIVPNPAAFNIDNNIFPTSSNMPSYPTSADCESNTNANVSINFPAGANSVTYYLKATDIGIYNVDLQMTVSTHTNARPQSKFGALSSGDVTNSFTSIRTYGRTALPNILTVPGGKSDCNPLFISLIRADGTEFTLRNSSTVTLAPLRVQVGDPTGPETVGYGLYSDDACSSPVHTVGSAAAPAGSTITAPGINSTFYKLWVKPDNTNTFGPRKLMFYYQSKFIGSARFDLTDPNH